MERWWKVTGEWISSSLKVGRDIKSIILLVRLFVRGGGGGRRVATDTSSLVYTRVEPLSQGEPPLSRGKVNKNKGT